MKIKKFTIWFIIIISFGLILFATDFISLTKKYFRVYSLKKEIAKAEETKELSEKRLQRLQNDPEYLNKIVRTDLQGGVVAQDELIFVFDKKDTILDDTTQKEQVK